MEFRKILALRGPNLWARFPVMELWVDLGPYRDAPSDSLPGFADRLMAWLPSMVEHRCGLGYRGGFFERLRTGTYMGHILEHVTLELQCLAGTEVGYGKARETSEEGVYKVVIEYEEEQVVRAAIDVAHRMLEAAVHDHPFDVTAEVAALTSLNHRVKLGPSTSSIVEAARKRGIPARRLNADSLVMLGNGARQRRIVAAETDAVSAISESIAQDKELTRDLLRAVGVPVPEGRPVSGAEDAWAAAQELGGAVVVKPQYGNQGRGVATNLRTRDQVLAAYAAAREESSRILVEQFAPGADHRLLVVGGRVVAASRREPAQVVGDGESTVARLVERVNDDPRRVDGHVAALSLIKLDAIALAVLAEQGYSPDSVPPAGAVVLCRRNANLSTGGTAADVTDMVHPEVAARAVDAARVIGLDVAGVDVVALDVSTPLEEQGGVVVEVNAGPGLRMHLEPSSGKPRDVGKAIIDLMFPGEHAGRVPIVAVTGVNGKTTTTRLIAHMLTQSGKVVGLTCTDGVYVGGRRIESGDCSGPKSARRILLNPAVEAAALEVARGGILREGLGFDACDVGVVMNIGEGDHLGLGDIQTLEKLAQVKRVVVESATGSAVLKADDPLTAAMAEHCPGEVVFFARNEHDPVLAAHRAKGGRSAFVRQNLVILCDGGREEMLIPLPRVPLTYGGRIGFQVENVLAASAAAWSLGISLVAIRAALESFASDGKTTPGRFNVLHAGGACVILDYGHNPSALEALIEAVDQFPHRRRTAVYSAAGDRRDADIIRQGQQIADAFDRVILYEDACQRGREEGTIIALLRQGTALGTRAKSIEDIQGESAGAELALRAMEPGDLVVIQADQVEETLEYVARRLSELFPPTPAVTDASVPPEGLASPAPVDAAPVALQH